jgi:hypothetical protein
MNLQAVGERIQVLLVSGKVALMAVKSALG